ncbi:hypothetical protein KVP70_11170 [Duganella sp. HSC-15S17]|uniref:Uncharacterized protein n=1 Tax=Duganella violaceipulchra TaxID=2849652 RepID=A0AA41H4P4_9BURK|nr:hypothetical protein [Duganella violaceicalia]
MRTDVPFRTLSSRATLLALLLGMTMALAHAPLLAQSIQAAPGAPTTAAQRSEALTAARRDFAQFVASSTSRHAGTLPAGFPLDVSDVQDLKDARVGHGFQIYTVDPQDLVAGRSDLSAMAKPSPVWRFVLNLHDRPIGLVTVEQVNGHWQAVAFGASTLAQDVEALMAFHGNADRSNLRFIRIYQAQSDFLEVAANGTARFAPLHSARQSLQMQQRAAKAGKPDDGLMDAAAFLDPLRGAVKANLDAFR